MQVGLHHQTLRKGRALIVLALTCAPLPALGDNCKSSGGLRFVGTTADSSKTVWLSGTIAGSYRLEAAQGNQTVDTWDITRSRGLHISSSPVVSNGNGGTHRLFDTGGGKDCLIDTQNQKGGLTLPPNITLPWVTLPGRPLPPIGDFFPDFRPLPLPTRPGGVTPPIGTLPPTGITPGLPGGVTPPIGTLPPTGITPGLPGGVMPPIGTLPPTGITPGLPGGVMPPIGTLPPTGITPGLPAQPGGVTPPEIARPLSPGQALMTDGRTQRTNVPACVDARTKKKLRPGEVYCQDIAPAGPGSGVPLTPGRDLGVQTLWNAWAQFNHVGISDRRNGLDLNNRAGSVTAGLDRRLSSDAVVGVSLSLQDSRAQGFGDFMRVETNGFSIGPYVAVRLSPHWAMDATLTYGRVKSAIDLAVLNGNYESDIYSGSFSLHGQYIVAGFHVRPRASLYYSHVRSGGHDLAGFVFGFPVGVAMPASHFNAGVVEASGEISRVVLLSGNIAAMPYLEIGTRYEFDRPYGGEILAGDLSPFIPSPWTGFVRPGVRMSFAPSLLVEVAGGYLSIGQNGLDVWEGKFRVSYGF